MKASESSSGKDGFKKNHSMQLQTSVKLQLQIRSYFTNAAGEDRRLTLFLEARFRKSFTAFARINLREQGSQ